MAIGILALTIGIVFSAVGLAGIGGVQPPVQAEKPVQYPYPRELN